MMYRNHDGSSMSSVMEPPTSFKDGCYARNVPRMVTKPARPPQKITLTTPKLYLREWRKHCGISATDMADKLAIERESVYRLEREQWRVSADDQLIYAQAFKIDPKRLWDPPGGISLDELLHDLPKEMRPMAADMAAGILKRFADQD